jgi:hypothetical protein
MEIRHEQEIMKTKGLSWNTHNYYFVEVKIDDATISMDYSSFLNQYYANQKLPIFWEQTRKVINPLLT